MARNSTPTDDIIQFIRKRDYILERELGQGACGKTVLLHDNQIDEHFVCKKYVPYSETHRQELFSGFVREIKLLHKIHHPNIVRVFNYYLYPDQVTGYILMEYIDGADIDDYLTQRPEQTNEVFLQTISGFSYLQQAGILHRDIRPGNVMVRDDGIVKIIDLGFGKEVRTSEDFEKSIDLNWWCPPPKDFEDSRYDFCTEVYFVGKLFEGIIRDNGINHFQYTEILNNMCSKDPETRSKSFNDIEKQIGSNQFFEIGFTESEQEAYRNFAAALYSHITKIDNKAKYANDIDRIRSQLEDVYRNIMLEQFAPDSAGVLRCFVIGTYYYKKAGFSVACIRDFLRLIKSSTDEKNRIILANLHTRLDALPRYSQEDTFDDVPF